jgi:pyruvate,water dikinase
MPNPTSELEHSIRSESRPKDLGSPILWLDEVGATDNSRVGGKASSLGELRRELAPLGVRVPNGFVTTVDAYKAFLDMDVPSRTWKMILGSLPDLDDGVPQRPTLLEALEVVLAAEGTDNPLGVHDRSGLARSLCLATPIPASVRDATESAYRELCREYGGVVDVAVRSSGTREDSESASFAGQHDSVLNVRGADAILEAWRRCAASAFTERAVSYQIGRGLDPRDCAVAVVVMKMVRSDLASSGVVFTLDPDSGNSNIIHVTSAYGLGEPIVQGSVSPDTFLLFKNALRDSRTALVDRKMGDKEEKMIYGDDGRTTRVVPVMPEDAGQWSLTSEEVAELAGMALAVEDHYGRPMDIEWAKDGATGDIFLVQARPETVHSGFVGHHAREVFSMDPDLVASLEREGRVLARGQAVGSRIGAGRVRRYASYAEVIAQERAERERVREGGDTPAAGSGIFEPGDVLVTEMTTPDWEPLMKRASLIVTEKGGRTSHAAIVAREFGIPAIVGCGASARALEPLSQVTGSCAEGETGYVFEGIHPFEVTRMDAADTEGLTTDVKLNVGFPDKAMHDAMLPSDGVGLARLEFILTSQVGIHPLLLAYYDDLRTYARTGIIPDGLAPFVDVLRRMGPRETIAMLEAVDERSGAYSDKRAFFVDRLKYGIARICAAFHPRPVLVRLSDLKSNEYRDLLGGTLFEPLEENPMIAWRGASRYTDARFRAAFDMEAEALVYVRHDMGLDNLQIMVPFCRTPEEGRAVVEVLEEHGLSPREDVPLFLMVELPSNVIEADQFIDEMQLTGGSIGTNDLVQTVYALSRDDLAGYPYTVDARSPAVRSLMRDAIESFRSRGLEIGICGQAPSDHPDEVPAFLVECGITSISVTADTLLEVRAAVKRAEAQVRRADGALSA